MAGALCRVKDTTWDRSPNSRSRTRLGDQHTTSCIIFIYHTPPHHDLDNGLYKFFFIYFLFRLFFFFVVFIFVFFVFLLSSSTTSQTMILPSFPHLDRSTTCLYVHALPDPFCDVGVPGFLGRHCLIWVPYWTHLQFSVTYTCLSVDLFKPFCFMQSSTSSRQRICLKWPLHGAWRIAETMRSLLLLNSCLYMGQYQIAVRFGLAHKMRMKCHKSHFICFHHNLKIIGSSY